MTDQLNYTSASLSKPGDLSQRIILMHTAFASDGVLFAFVAFFLTNPSINNRPIQLTVWRPMSYDASQFKLVCQHRINVSEAVATTSSNVKQDFTRVTVTDITMFYYYICTFIYCEKSCS